MQHPVGGLVAADSVGHGPSTAWRRTSLGGCLWAFVEVAGCACGSCEGIRDRELADTEAC